MRQLFLMCLIGFFSGQDALAGLATMRDSVYKIRVVSRDPEFATPWVKTRPSNSSGTGFYIGKNKIMTNAHVVANATYISVQKDGDSQPVQARVEFVGHDCDLAILVVDKEKYFAGTRPLKFGSLPKLRTPVATIGFPTGGEQISITEGIVSRVGYRKYVHDGHKEHLLVQVDSAINPGNSGGPVVQGRNVVGVAFQAYTQAENTGYIIPTPVVKRFLKDIEDGTYEGHPDDGLVTSSWTMMNTSAREFYGLAEDDGGVEILDVVAYAPTHGLIKQGDILVAIDGRSIGVDGKVTFSGERVDFRTVYDLKNHGDTTVFQVIRNQKKLDVEVVTAPSKPHHAMGNSYARYPKYYVFGGMVFTTLSRSYLRTWGSKWYRKAPLLLRYLEFYSWYEKDSRNLDDIIVFARRMPHDVNRYVGSHVYGVVVSVDGKKVSSIKQFADLMEKGSDQYAVVDFWGSTTSMIVDRAKALAANAEIKAQYSIEPDRWFHGSEIDATDWN